MELQLTEQILPFAGAALVLALLLHVAWNNRRDPVAHWFAAALVAMVVWAVGYCLEIMAIGLDAKMLYANIQFLGIATVSVCWWEMIRRYLDLGRTPKALTAFLWTIAFATIFMAFANPSGLFRGAPSLVTEGVGFPVLHADYGPWYWWVLVPQITLLNLAVLVALARRALSTRGFLRKQYALLFAAVVMPLLAAGVYVAGVPPLQDYNLTVAVSGLSGLLMGMGLFRWRLFNIVLLAHDRVVEDLADGVIVVDRTGRVVDLNKSAQKITGVKSLSAAGQPAAEAFAAYPALVEMLTETDLYLPEISSKRDMVIKRGGIQSYYALSSSTVGGRRGGPLGTAVIMHDITERVRLFEQARELANKDDLTGMPNRRHFFELTSKELERSARYGQPVSLLIFDVDHFKTVNDTYGHRAGDRVLRDIARVCRDTLRTNDVIGRIGGEEFAVLLPETVLEQAVEVAERLRDALRSVEILGDSVVADQPSAVTISVGAAQLQGGDRGPRETLDSLLERADRALYAAKAGGRDNVVESNELSGLRAVG